MSEYDELLDRLEAHAKRHVGDRYRQLRKDLYEARKLILKLEAKVLDADRSAEPTEVVVAAPVPATKLIEPEKSTELPSPAMFDYDDIQDHEEQPPEAYETKPPKRKWWSA